MTCRRCGQPTPRLTASQVHCPRCEAETRRLIAQDAARRASRFPAKDLSGWAR